MITEAAMNTTAPGTHRHQPVRGLGQARDAVRAVLATPEGRSRGVTITLRAGTYGDGPLRLSAADSGGPGTAVTWRGEPGSLLSGGVQIPTSAWSLAPAPRRPADVGAGAAGRAGAGAVWQANLTALGLSAAALGAVGQGGVLDGRGEANAWSPSSSTAAQPGHAGALAEQGRRWLDGVCIHAGRRLRRGEGPRRLPGRHGFRPLRARLWRQPGRALLKRLRRHRLALPTPLCCRRATGSGARLGGGGGAR
jgi:hypothetical protein